MNTWAFAHALPSTSYRYEFRGARQGSLLLSESSRAVVDRDTPTQKSQAKYKGEDMRASPLYFAYILFTISLYFTPAFRRIVRLDFQAWQQTFIAETAASFSKPGFHRKMNFI